MNILLVDDHKVLRDGLRAILEKEEGFHVVGEAGTGRDAVELARSSRPDVVVMDISMPDLNGVDATRRLVAEMRGIRVLALSVNSDRRYIMAMFQAGAVGFLPKNVAAEELIRALRAVASNLTYVSPSIASVFVSEWQEDPRPPSERAAKSLSLREREVLQLLAEGNSSKDIASRLDLAVTTVETHRRQIMEKLKLRTIAELTKYAIREGLTSLE